MILALETNVMDIISKNKQVSFRGVPHTDMDMISESLWEYVRDTDGFCVEATEGQKQQFGLRRREKEWVARQR
jgi:hypothetical protein